VTITLELTPETEAKLLAQAKARGLTLDAFVLTIISNQAATMEALKSLENIPSGDAESDRVIDELFDAVELPPGVGEGAMRRENWYR
jgi:uncharacterized protein (DUF1778 family)